MSNKLTKKYLDIPDDLPNNTGMGKTQAVQSVNTPTPEDSELSEISDYIDIMQQYADDGEPTALHWFATGGPERYRLRMAQA